jgi:hypothetical protein
MAEAPNAFNDAVIRFIDAVDETSPLVVREAPDPAG